jgi:hypothetical protein
VILILVDYSGTFATNKVIVDTGGINLIVQLPVQMFKLKQMILLLSLFMLIQQKAG